MEQELIKSLGGIQDVASALNVKPGVVANWKLEGRSIPWKHRPAIAMIAATKGVPIPADFLNGAAA